MNQSLNIGKAGRQAFTLPPDVQTQTIAVLGIRGSGKTNTAAVVVEELLAQGRQVVVVDPTDVWWGLRSSADGRSAGQPIVVAGGPHGQVPLSAHDGGVLADFVVSERASLVFSLRHLRKADQRRFVTEFAEQLYHRKGETAHRTPLLVVIDECDAFIPQRVGGAEARMVGAIEDLVRRGRAAGIGVTLISQRAASVNKDVLTQLELLVAHRHTSPQDRKALDAWVEAHDTAGRREQFMADLAALPVGAAWFWSPGWLDVFARVAVRARRTFDSSATPTSGTVQAPRVVAEVDLDGLRQKLAATIQEAEANDPRALKQRVAELEQQLAASTTSADEAHHDHADAVIAACADRDLDWQLHLSQVVASLDMCVEDWEHTVSEIGETLHNVRRSFDEMLSGMIPGADPEKSRANQEARRRVTLKSTPSAVTSHPAVGRSNIPRVSAGGSDNELNAYQRDLLAVLLDRSPVPTPRGQLGALAHRSIKSSAFGPNLRSLVDRGLAEDTGRGYVATPAAQAACPDHRRVPRSGRAALEHWLGRLPTYESSLLQAIAEAGAPLLAEQVAAAAGKSTTSSAFRPALRNLLELGHVERDGDRYRLGGNFAA